MTFLPSAPGVASENELLGPWQACRKEVLTKWKRGKIDEKTLSNQLAICKERYPAAEVYSTCKKSALDDAAKNGKTAAEARTEVERCVRKGKVATVSTSATIPVFRSAQGEFTFAGLGFNRPWPVSDVKYPDFNCENLTKVAALKAKPEYLGFGNHPALFKGYRSLAPDRLESLLTSRKRKKVSKASLKKERDEGFQVVKGLGRVYGLPLTTRTSVLFPLGYCFATRKLDDKYREMKVYYLIDAHDQLAWPYLGVAFYEPEARVQREKVIEVATKVIGEKVQPSNSPKGGKVVLASDIVASWDEEGDPRDLCIGDRTIPVLAMFKESLQVKNQGDFFLFANINNLCQYGDKVAERLSRKRRVSAK